VKGRLALVSLAALAWAEAAAAQPAISVAPGDMSRLAQEALSPGAGGTAPSALQAPVVTNIAPDAGKLSLGTQVMQAGNVHTIDGGTRAGNNLFHSFSRFDLGQGDFARWAHSAGDPTSVQNVVNRVTGGDPSRIFGTIDSTALPNADFFFINPAGIVFGEGAQVNVPAAAYFSTAHELRFADGPVFTVATPGGSTFSVANPVAFGFVGAAGDIAVTGSGSGNLAAGPANLSLSAANVALLGATIEAPSIRVAAVGSKAASVPLSGPLGTARAGRIDLLSATRLTARGGGIQLAGGAITLHDAAVLAADGGGIVIDLTGPLLMDGARIDSRTLGLVPGVRGGDIRVTAGSIRLINDSSIAATALGSTGDAGRIAILGLPGARARLTVDSGSSIRSDTVGSGQAGTIAIEVDTVELRGGGVISSDSGRSCAETGCGPLGDAGDIEIKARTLRLDEPDLSLGGTGISSDTFGGDAGNIRIALSGDLVITGAARISSDNIGEGDGGMIAVVADNILLSGARGGFSADTFRSGRGGSIRLEAMRSIRIEDEAQVTTQSGGGRAGGNAPLGQGASGDIGLFAPAIVLAGGGSVSASTFSDGNAGAITVEAGRLTLTEFSSIASRSAGAGNGGPIMLTVDELVMRDSAAIENGASFTCDFCPPGGSAGSITIAAGRIEMTGGEDEFGLLNRPQIASDTDTSGAAGNITIDVTGPLMMTQAEIGSRTGAGGRAGVIRLAAESITLGEDSRISTSSVPLGDTPTRGDAGDIALFASGDIAILSGSEVASNTGGSGRAGEVTVGSFGTLLIDGGRISSGSTAGSTGASGLVSIDVARLQIDGGGIDTVSRNAQRAGAVAINAGEVVLRGTDAVIASANRFETGDAGAVLIVAGNIALLDGARITTSAFNGAAGDIGLTLPAGGLLRLESAGEPSVITTSSLPGSGGRIIVSSPRAIISNGGSILALGEQGGANVELGARYLISSSDRTNRIDVDGNFLLEAIAYDVSSGTVNRDLSVIDASGVLRGQCAAVRQTGQASQLVVRPIGPYGTRPISARPADPTADPARLLTAAELQDRCA